ncbi:MAG: hypothetical protein HQL26_00435 [Candidatus Omnitrophica bacterium]|nr:hypothetical protein [Candidatus Omnitrophota bacterium]
MAVNKSTFKKCSVKGCRNKGLANGRCLKHAKISASTHVAPVKRTVSHIKKVRAAHVEHVKEPEVKVVHAAPEEKKVLKLEAPAVMKHKEQKVSGRHKGPLNSVCYWAGTFFSDTTEIFKIQKAK